MPKKVTPVRKQYLQIKAQHPDAIVFFRLGDFYETFDEDAETAARELDLVLTSRPVAKGVRVPMAGVPYHAIEGYISRLIEKGYRVAIAEQVGEVTGKGLVAREVTRVVTPGTVVEPALLDEKRPNYLAAVVIEGDPSAPLRAGRAGLAYADITTGEFATAQLDADEVTQELARLQPRECLMPEDVGQGARSKKPEAGSRHPASSIEYPVAGMHLTPLPAYRFELGAARQALLDHFGVATLEGFGCAGKPLAIRAAGAIIHYLRETQKGALAQIVGLSTYSTSRFMMLDAATRRNLELSETIRERKTHGSLLGVLDLTLTPMGGRLLRARLAQPLLDRAELEARLDQVQAFYEDTIARGRVREVLKGTPDLERLTNRVLAGIATPRDLVGIRKALKVVPELTELLARFAIRNSQFAPSLDLCEDVAALVASAIVDDPPANVSAGGVIRPGFSAELDSIATAARDARAWIANLEKEERTRTGIKSLKVGYNKVFGYYIEVTKTNLDAVPDDYIRKQTLVETRLFKEVCQQVGARAGPLLKTARALARLDVAAALAEVAVRNRYVRAELTGEDVLEIVAGRHPVVEQTLRDEPFTSNDLRLNSEERILVITGQHGRKKCVLTAERSDRADGADGQFRARRPGADRHCGPHLHSHRRAGRGRLRPIHLYGRDGRDGQHPQPCHAAQPAHPRRDWAGHQHLRRPLNRLGGGRILAQSPRAAGANALCHPLPRVDRTGRAATGGAQLQPGGGRGGRARRLPAQSRARRGGPLLRHPRGAVGRRAALGSPPGRGTAGTTGER